MITVRSAWKAQGTALVVIHLPVCKQQVHNKHHDCEDEEPEHSYFNSIIPGDHLESLCLNFKTVS